MNKLKIAQLFGSYLDEDNYAAFVLLLKPECHYFINETHYNDRQTISDLYENNMVEGHKKFDKLVWGKCEVKEVSENQFDVYFSDFLTKKDVTHNYKCKQRISIDDNNLIEKIQHFELKGEREKLNDFYAKVF